MSTPKFVIVVGTSAGGLNALSEFVSQLNDNINAAILIVMHLSGASISDFIVRRLQPLTKLHCAIAIDEALLKKGHIYIAPANLHLLVVKDQILLGRGPEENRWRPSIDVLFRSAAVAYNSRVIGVILTGLLNDGTTGMITIKKCGGTTIVQEPTEAEYPDMPLSVIEHMTVDYCISLANIGEVISGIIQTTPPETPVPDEIRIESEISQKVVIGYDHVKQLGEKSIYACPDCGGGLWELNNADPQTGKVTRYRCHIGHSYSEKDLVIKQGEIFETTLWVALRIMEERRNLFNKMETDHAKKGLISMAKDYARKADKIQEHVDKMKAILFDSQPQP